MLVTQYIYSCAIISFLAQSYIMKLSYCGGIFNIYEILL